MKHSIRFLAAALALLLCASPSAMAVEIETPNVDASMHDKPKPRQIPLEGQSSRVYMDIPYCGENSTETQKLHILLPDEGEGPYPVLISLHGGAFSRGNTTKEHEVSFTQEAAFATLDRGYAVVCVDYTVKSKENPVAFPLQIQETRAAVRFIRSVASQYDLDPEHIALIGESAGGTLVSMAGLTGGEEYYYNADLGNMEYSAEVQAVIAQYPGVKMGMNDMTARLYNVPIEELTQEMCDAVTALAHIDSNDPPFFIEHGTADSTIPYTDSVEFYEALVAAGVPCEIRIYEGYEHAVALFQSDYVNAQHLDWLDQVFGR